MEGCNPTVFHDGIVPLAPEDPLFGLMAAYKKDDFDKKVDLGIGAYRDNNAQPWVLPVVKQVIPIQQHRDLNIIGLTVLSGGGITSQGPQAQSRISANRWSCRLHHSSTEAHTRSRQPRHKGQAGKPPDLTSARLELITLVAGCVPPNYFRHRCCPPRRPLPRTLLPSEP